MLDTPLAKTAVKVSGREQEIEEARTRTRAARMRIAFLREEQREKINLFLSEFELALRRRSFRWPSDDAASGGDGFAIEAE